MKICLNLLVPYDDRALIDARVGPEFQIISSSKNRKTHSRLFVIETTENEFLFLKLKYGRDIWKR